MPTAGPTVLVLLVMLAVVISPLSPLAPLAERISRLMSAGPASMDKLWFLQLA